MAKFSFECVIIRIFERKKGRERKRGREGGRRESQPSESIPLRVEALRSPEFHQDGDVGVRGGWWV